jgi:hypothetical protein
MGMEGAKAAGCRFENLERWSRFFRARAGVRLTEWRSDGDAAFLTLVSREGIEGLTLLLPEGCGAQDAGTGKAVAVREVTLEGRRQSCAVVNLTGGAPLRLRLDKKRENIS